MPAGNAENDINLTLPIIYTNTHSLISIGNL